MDINKKFWGLPLRANDFNGMPYKNYGSSGLKVPPLGLGTWKFGFSDQGDGSKVDEELAHKIFDKALELGVTFWDTANRYNDASGNSERVIGSWFKKHPDERRNIILATKLFNTMDGITPNHCGLSRTNILESTYASLERLGLDYIDILQFHAFDPDAPIKESLEAIKDLISMDKVRYFGVSNFNFQQVTQYLEVAEKYNLPRIQSVQNNFNPLDGELPDKKGVFNLCQQEKITFIPYSPLKRGLLSDKYVDQNPKEGDRVFDEKIVTELNPKIKEKLKRLKDLANENEITVSALVLAYLISLGMLPIPSASTAEQLEENSKATHLKLDSARIQEIEKIFKA